MQHILVHFSETIKLFYKIEKLTTIEQNMVEQNITSCFRNNFEVMFPELLGNGHFIFLFVDLFLRVHVTQPQALLK